MKAIATRLLRSGLMRGSLHVMLLCIGLVLIAPCRAADTPTIKKNKQLVLAFYDAAINRKDFAAAVTYLGPQYRQHNPTAADGAEGLKSFIEFLKSRFPNQRGEVTHVIAEGDLVVLHVHSTRGDDTPGRAIVDIFRVAAGKVVEHWDVIQDIPRESANSNGMF